MNLFVGQSVLLLNMPLPLAKFRPEGRGCSKILHGYNKSSVSSQPSLLKDNQSLECKCQKLTWRIQGNVNLTVIHVGLFRTYLYA